MTRPAVGMHARRIDAVGQRGDTAWDGEELEYERNPHVRYREVAQKQLRVTFSDAASEFWELLSERANERTTSE